MSSSHEKREKQLEQEKNQPALAGDEADAAANIASEKDAERGLRPGQSAQNFWPSTKRLIREIGPERKFLAIAILIGTVSVALSVIGPASWAAPPTSSSPA